MITLMIPLVLVYHHAMWRKRELFFDFIEIGFSFHMWEQLALIGRHSLQQHCQMGHSSQEALVVVGIEIVPRLMQSFEAPSIQLPREGLIFALYKVFGHNVSNQKLLVVDLPCPAVWLS